MITAARDDGAEDIPAPAEFDPLELRKALGQFPQGIVAVAAEVDGHPEVLVASSFTVGSPGAPLVTVAVQHTSSTWPKLRDRASRLGISVLGAQQSELTRQLASTDRAWPLPRGGTQDRR
ncbi:flavin reductase [Nesterenkonia pannonica]|uniref:flavin reductase family protein n=1 Tax=Nesterenkonia pannonica TaxID=1548602 RepID=UPI002164CEF3|nr:flavin reductase [Nesterenkonia pannonica]